ncbi:NADP-dependent oxidoreductase domain-containing protein [Lentinula boryana]|uniref:NADP-dependent oxidoreductase domain-containing protein n=1 Tax=Lentinula boryana TaxID=40481 RepID=A0ABQ8Q3R0_9AGAR|nr:NADP-dependent oxidoreductase domain-containing protein [Lentinula boryana]
MSLPLRKIGNAQVSAIGFGAMGLSGFYGEAVTSDEDRFKVLDAAFEKGCRLWDTADIYNDNEELIGKWLKRTGNRDKVFIATKVGYYHKPEVRLVNGDADYILEAANKSLKKLDIPSVDLLYLHRADVTVPIEVTVGAMAQLVKCRFIPCSYFSVTLIGAYLREGKVKYLGLSEVSVSTIRRAHAVHPISAVQVEYSPFNLEIEDEQIGVLKVCRELGITIVAYSPLGRGILTGQVKSAADFPEGDFRKIFPKYSQENFPNILKLADGLKEIGKKHNATAGQVALAWLLAQGDDIIPIPGTKKVKYLEENLGAVNVKLSDEDLKLVREYIAKSDATKGARYPEWGMHLAYADTPELPK